MVGSAIDRALTDVGTPTEVLLRYGIAVRGRMAFCIFHPDHRRPNMSLFRGTDGKERFKCHACGAKGDALDLEAALTGMSVRDLITR